jgi:hypothetical protein
MQRAWRDGPRNGMTWLKRVFKHLLILETLQSNSHPRSFLAAWFLGLKRWKCNIVASWGIWKGLHCFAATSVLSESSQNILSLLLILTSFIILDTHGYLSVLNRLSVNLQKCINLLGCHLNPLLGHCPCYTDRLWQKYVLLYNITWSWEGWALWYLEIINVKFKPLLLLN